MLFANMTTLNYTHETQWILLFSIETPLKLMRPLITIARTAGLTTMDFANNLIRRCIILYRNLQDEQWICVRTYILIVKGSTYSDGMDALSNNNCKDWGNVTSGFCQGSHTEPYHFIWNPSGWNCMNLCRLWGSYLEVLRWNPGLRLIFHN